MTRTTYAIKTLAALCLLLGLTASARAAADPNGTWKWTVSRGGNDIEFTLSLKADGEKLTGALSLPNGMSVDISNGTVKNDEVAFETVFEFNGNSIKTKYSGKVDGDAIKGKTERERDGQVMSRDWEAKREKK